MESIMTLSGRLREKSPAIAERWLEGALADYPADSAAVFRRQKDPFGNPVGHALRVGTRAAVEALLAGQEPDAVCAHLDEIVKMRAVQEFQPSRAISFVFLLKEAIRAELAAEDPGEALSSELAEFGRRIDLVALGAFDLYMHHRGRVYELRINEVKRSVAQWTQMAERRRRLSQSGDDRLQPGPPERDASQRDDGP
jgi:hypothetical protein